MFGLPVLLTVLYMMFRFAFDVASPLVDAVDLAFSWLHDLVYALPLDPVLASFLDGIVSGLGSVMVFLPNIALLFAALAVLENVGYMARAAFLVDKAMSRLGLTGKSIIPMIVGFGCNVPAVMATRAIEDENDRKTTALVVPLMSCSARLPIYLVFAAAFFAAYQGTVVLSMYMLGLGLAFLTAIALRKLVFKGPSSGFIMELPPYMLPTLRGVLWKTWERTKKFLYKAGTVILAGVIAAWLLSVTGPAG